jgi:hypothetical protein
VGKSTGNLLEFFGPGLLDTLCINAAIICYQCAIQDIYELKHVLYIVTLFI